MSVKNVLTPEMYYGIPVFMPGDSLIATTTVTATSPTNSASGGNAMTAYRTQQQNSNWLFGNPVAADINSFIQANTAFQSRFVQGAEGAGRTLQTGLNQIAEWSNRNANLLWWVGGGVVGVVIVRKLLSGKTRRR
jgi:hypothetical protein